MDEKVFHAGGVEFHVDNRNFGEDGGPSVRVFGEAVAKIFSCYVLTASAKTRIIITIHQERTIIGTLIKLQCRIRLHGQLNNSDKISLR